MEPRDPLALAGAAAVAGLVAFCSVVPPSLRAATAHPLTALRRE